MPLSYLDKFWSWGRGEGQGVPHPARLLFVYSCGGGWKEPHGKDGFPRWFHSQDFPRESQSLGMLTVAQPRV